MNTQGSETTPSLADRKSKLIISIYDATENLVAELEQFIAIKTSKAQFDFPQSYFESD